MTWGYLCILGSFECQNSDAIIFGLGVLLLLFYCWGDCVSQCSLFYVGIHYFIKLT